MVENESEAQMSEVVKCVDNWTLCVYNCCVVKLANSYIDKIDQKTTQSGSLQGKMKQDVSAY